MMVLPPVVSHGGLKPMLHDILKNKESTYFNYQNVLGNSDQY